MEILSSALIYLVAAVIAVPLAQRLGLGSVLGYLIAGLLIGPVFGFIGSEAANLQHFAEFGVVMMLFLVGLELRPSMLWDMRGQLIGLGGLQVLSSTAIIAIIAHTAFDLPWQQSVAVGMVLALSSTAIVLQTLGEKGWFKTAGGKSSFSVLLTQDIAVIPMLAIMPLLAVSDTGQTNTSSAAGTADPTQNAILLDMVPDWAQIFVIIAAIATIVIGGRYLMRPVFRYIAKTHLREVFTAAALLLVISTALLMVAIGLSPALGTFLAGVVLSDSEYRPELENDIEPFKGLLLGLFFLTVGAGINLNLLIDEPATLFGIAFGIMAIKAAVLFVISSTARMCGADRTLFSLGLSQAGEFAFVLFGMAVGVGALPGDLVQKLTLAVALTMMLTPLAFLLYERVLAPRIVKHSARDADVIDDTGSVVLAGIGRFGQIVTRLLATNGHRVVVLDHDPEVIENLGRIGFRAYYGDAMRPDLLHNTGIENAKLFVAAIDDREKLTSLVAHVAKHYPNVRILARAIDRLHVFELENAGAHFIERETFESALNLGRDALIELGETPARAERKKTAFRKHDFETLDKLRVRWNDSGVDKQFIDTLRSQNATLIEIMRNEQEDSNAGNNTKGNGKPD
ncbi:monovalent cation:proton antiporter-2 (CPA2) family protein [Thalassospira sp.]|uniref:monovalent cation:proton antiporter-2 (CPA2) family protein n=1 Tax=Thalassospira sp. TaxID=1912094 RepID=UPI000C5806FE|nr:monovalent cation:proton antiporter-2 (CPA2) family protein [Thalassospira sp.]MBC07367.1 potassium transporter [Thalassospira sp.]